MNESPSSEEMREVAIGLSRLHAVRGVNKLVYRWLVKHACKVQDRALRVMDLASGDGALPIQWLVWARQDGVALSVTTLDRSCLAIQWQHQHANVAGILLNTLERDCLSSPLPSGYDVIICSHLLHSLDHAQAKKLLQAMDGSALRGSLVCDFERGPVNAAINRSIAHCVSRSKYFHHEIDRICGSAYTHTEFASLAENALLRPIPVKTLVTGGYIGFIDDVLDRIPNPAFA